MRVKTIRYLMAVEGLENGLAIVAENGACHLQIECSVIVDGITGNLVELMMAEVNRPGFSGVRFV